MRAEPSIPDDAAHLLATLREPRRLRILIALECRPRSSIDLKDDLGLSYTEISYAVKEMTKAGLLELRADVPTSRRGRGADLVKVYGTTHKGWTRMVRTLNAIAGTR